MNRRRFLGGLLAATAFAPVGRAHAAALSFGPASFDVTATSALVWVRASGGAQVRIEYGTNADLTDAAMTPPVPATGATDYTVVTELVDLTPDTEYFYRGLVSDDGGEWIRGAIGRFRTAPVTLREFVFAWSGDMEAGHRPFALLDHVTALRPEFFLMVGDTMYADVPKQRFVASLAHYRAKHRENREDGPLQRLLAAVPTTAIWDDHEVQNDFDRTHPARAVGRQAFREYWPARATNALYRHFTWTPAVEVFVLDCRSYRSPRGFQDVAARTMLGEAQKAWLKDGLARSKATFKVIVSSVAFLPPARMDSWNGYQAERHELVDFIRREQIRNIVVLSADLHHALEYEAHGIHEYVAGPIGAWVHCRGDRAGERRQALEASGRFFICDGANFGAFVVRPDATPPQLEAQLIDAQGTVRHRRIVVAS